jgi:hypothetical protein
MTEDRRVYGTVELRRETRLPFSSGQWIAPTGEEIAQVLRSAGMSGGQAARVMGIAPQRVRELLGGKATTHYAPWRLLLIETRLALDESRGELEAGLRVTGSSDQPKRSAEAE